MGHKPYMFVKIASWNVNSLRTRLSHVRAWWAENSPDVLCLQETKVEDALFPAAQLADIAPHMAVFGQKSYNGVAILSRHPLSGVEKGFSATGYAARGQARLVRAQVLGVTVASVYVPNGEALGSEKFAFKEEFYHQLGAEMQAVIAQNPKVALLGDFNIAADERDVANPARAVKDVLFTPAEQGWLRALQTETGLTDALRLHNAEAGQYTWWDYRTYGRNPQSGMRIDYAFASRALAPQVHSVAHGGAERAKPQPSDHVPVVLTLAL